MLERRQASHAEPMFCPAPRTSSPRVTGEPGRQSVEFVCRGPFDFTFCLRPRRPGSADRLCLLRLSVDLYPSIQATLIEINDASGDLSTTGTTSTTSCRLFFGPPQQRRVILQTCLPAERNRPRKPLISSRMATRPIANASSRIRIGALEQTGKVVDPSSRRCTVGRCQALRCHGSPLTDGGYSRTAALGIGVLFGAQIGARLSRLLQGSILIRLLAFAMGLVAIRLLINGFLG